MKPALLREARQTAPQQLSYRGVQHQRTGKATRISNVTFCSKGFFSSTGALLKLSLVLPQTSTCSRVRLLQGKLENNPCLFPGASAEWWFSSTWPEELAAAARAGRRLPSVQGKDLTLLGLHQGLQCLDSTVLADLLHLCCHAMECLHFCLHFCDDRCLSCVLPCELLLTPRDMLG